MRPVTVFVLLLFAGGVVWGDPCARALSEQAQHVVDETGGRPSQRAFARLVASQPTRGDLARRSLRVARVHRRPLRRGPLPAPRAPDRCREIA